ncbi:hypothetical protein Moror_3402 [Moniliophthora roreri MCA 2997]|uniref:Uncharacterized protein n=1 Tax=Moniliophthora roreri (strain MCA 2997) TaxID=1381753 RepID=V2X2C1_MONRO|nr:hypothetical protein Moror_3402 [Moniliophthora roreri MCA 2997]
MSSPIAKQPDSPTDFLYNAADILIVGFFYGMHFVLLCLTVPVLWRGNSGDIQAKRILLGLIFSMFALSTVVAGLDVAVDLLDAKMSVSPYITDIDKELYDMDVNNSPVIDNAEGLVFYFNILLGDCIVLWRAWILCTEELYISPFSYTLVQQVTTWLAYLAVAIRDKEDNYTSFLCSIFVLSAGTNILSTIATGYKVWLHRKTVKHFFTQPNNQSQGEKILVLILETGVVYSLVWVVGGVLSFSTLNVQETTTWSHISSMVDTAGRGIVSIYPTVLVSVIHFHKSLWDFSGTEVHQSPSLSEISFSHSQDPV